MRARGEVLRARGAGVVAGLCALAMALSLAGCDALPASPGTNDPSSAASDAAEAGASAGGAAAEAGTEPGSPSGDGSNAEDPAVAGAGELPERVMSSGGVPMAELPALEPAVLPDPEPGSPPRLEIDGLEGGSPLDDWGLIHPDGRTRRIYALRNHGGSPLKITIASGGCGCTQVRLGGAEIAPSEAITMSVTYRPDKDQKARGRTEVVKDVTVWSDDPERPTYKLAIRARFEPPGPEMAP